jgi:multicomponent Na+:H+ antiporter subunit D
MTPELALLGMLATPVIGALLVVLLSRPPGLRDVIHIGFAMVLAGLCLYLVGEAAAGHTARIALARPLPNVDLAFSLEPLGALMAAVISTLGVLHAAHTAGVVRATQEKSPARMMAFIMLAAAAVMGVAFSANLFTFFVAYQALTLATFPLVAHRGDDEARREGRIYLATLLMASAGLFLPAMVWTYAISGALDFRQGGVLAGHVDTLTANVLLVLFVLGLAMAAIPPVHRWLPISSGAPYPALVTIQALAVLPAGGIGLLKVSAYVFGPALSQAAFAARGLLVVVGVSMCVAALIALSKQDLRERLAYSCMAQSLAVAMGALLALPVGLFAAALQIVALASASATLMMAAGTVFAATGRRNVSDYTGLGRVMPWTFAGFALASASMIGMPPFSGAWAKVWLIAAAANAGLVWAAVLAGAAAVLTFAHLGPLAANALAGRAPTDAFKRPDGASVLLAAPVILCAAATLWLLVLADPLASFLAPLWTPRS